MRILVAGIGNVFLGDDGFGVDVARRLALCEWLDGVEVRDFGIRGMDLVYALMDDPDAAILVDVVSRGGEPGTLYLIEPQVDGSVGEGPDAHGMDPAKVLALAQTLGARPGRIYLVGCEPGFVVDAESSDAVVMELTPPVRAAVDGAVELVSELVTRLLREGERR